MAHYACHFTMMKAVLVTFMCCALTSSTLGARALVFESATSSFNATVTGQLKLYGLEVTSADTDNLTAALADHPDLVVLTDARKFPGKALEPLMKYLETKGCLLTIGAPAFETILVKWNNKWLSFAEAEKQVFEPDPEKIVFRFQPGDEKLFTRNTNREDSASRLQTMDGALSAESHDIDGWDVYMSKPMEKPFGDGQTVTVFEARGCPNTRRLQIGWRETDGSRWHTAVSLTTNWEKYALPAAAFRFTESGEAGARGGTGDHFHPENASIFSVGVAANYGPLSQGQQSWQIRNVGVSRDPLSTSRVELPKLETICPAYKTYTMQNVTTLKARTDQAVIPSGFEMKGNIEGRMPVWRMRGLAYAEGQLPPMRFVPIVDAFGKHDKWKGTAAWYLLHFDGAYAGGCWGGIGLNPEKLTSKEQEGIAELAAKMAVRMFSAPFIRAAGTNRFSALPGGLVTFGCAVSNLHGPATDLACSMSLVQENQDIPLMLGENVSLTSGDSYKWAGEMPKFPGVPGGGRVVTGITANSALVDIVSQNISILTKPVVRHKISVGGGQLLVEGKPFYANGVHYYPSSSIALEPGLDNMSNFGLWQFDPETLERDLQALREIKINLATIEFGNPKDAPQLQYVLDRFHAYGIVANIMLRGAHPLHQDLKHVKALIEAADLANNPNVMSYDLAWEPKLGRADKRAELDDRWKDWILEQYGSLERAEDDWDFHANRNADGNPTTPTDAQLVKDGKWRIMVAAYRRFADDLISRGYGKVTSFIRRLDPNHLLGVRTGFGGTGQAWPVPLFPYDLASGAAHLDIIEPETYGLSGSVDNYLKAGFTVEYGRLVSGGKPVLWAECGLSVGQNPFDPAGLKGQAEHYEKMFRMFASSHSNGSVAWWFPGGHRVIEGSDYGIVSPDVAPRPAALVMRDWAAKCNKALALPRPAGTILIDRDTHVDGYAGVWREARVKYLEALKQGRRITPVTNGTGTTSKDCPATAVGGGPWTGDNPPKYLNAEIVTVQVLSTNGEWVEWTGTPIKVKQNEPTSLRVSAVNTGEAKWLRKALGKGMVTLIASIDDRKVQGLLNRDVDSLMPAVIPGLQLPPLGGRVEVQLRMNCAKRGDFGQRVTVVLEAE